MCSSLILIEEFKLITVRTVHNAHLSDQSERYC
jgi:hypothetical protein